MPNKRFETCPAFAVCRAVGNATPGCTADSVTFDQDKYEKCIAGLILLIARGQGLLTVEQEQEIQKRRIGFDLSPDA